MRNTSHRKRVVVIGGGISGLAAAHQLRKIAPGLEVRLLERGSRLGGVIKTTRKDGFLVEGAADNFITTSQTAIELCNDLDLGDRLIRTNPHGAGAMVLSRGKLEPIPAGFMVMAPSRLWPLLATKILTPKGKLRSGCEIFIPRKLGNEDESLQSFVCRRFGTEMFERLVQPLVGGIYTADPARLSVAATMPRFTAMEHQHGSLIRGMLSGRRKQKQASEKRGGARYSQFMTLRDGMSCLIDALGKSLPHASIQFHSAVRELRHERAQWTIDVDNDSHLNADAVIIAAPASHASKMLHRVDNEMAGELGQIDYASCAIVSLAFDRKQIRHPLQSFGFVVPHVEEHFILSCSFSSEKYEGRAPEGTVLMRVFIGGALQSDLLRMSDTELKELAHWELAKLLDIHGPPLLKHITRQWHAMPQYHVGHQARVAKINRCLQTHPTLALAGSSLNGVGVPGCIESGQKAAQRIADALRPGSTIQRPQAALA